MPYNLVVSSDPQAFDAHSFTMQTGRCLEHTDSNLSEHFYRFGETRLDELLSFPTLLAHEEGASEQNVQLVKLTEIERRGIGVRARYESTGVELTYAHFKDLSSKLDIENFEYHRTHWAIKNIDLPAVLTGEGIRTPVTVFPPRPYVNLETHIFQIALSFPGEDRDLVQDIASRLEQRLGLNSVFYDFHYSAFLARPSLDVLLQSIYSKAHLNVVFLSENYERKVWCSGIEFRAIRELISNRQNDRVMFIRTGAGDVAGVFNIDGWIDSNSYSSDEISYFIEQRARVY